MQKKEYCIIGIDGFSLELARNLQENNAKVVLIDMDEDKVDSLASEFPYVYQLDATNINALENVGIDQFDIVVVGASTMEDSILIVSNLRKLQVQEIVAKVKNDVQKKILTSLGGDNIKIVWPDETVAGILSFRLLNDIDISISKDDKGISIIKLPVKNPKLFGNQISKFEIKSEYQTNIIMIKREDEVIFPVRSTTEIIKDDLITLACRTSSIPNVSKLFLGK